jgi:hypothetical protein
MPIELIVPLIQYGIPFVTNIITLWENKANVTAVQWEQLIALASVTAKAEATALLQKHNIDPASPAGQEILALIK